MRISARPLRRHAGLLRLGGGAGPGRCALHARLRSRGASLAAFTALAAAASRGGAPPRAAPPPPRAWSSPSVVVGEHFRGGGLPAGLRYCRDFVSPAEEAELLGALEEGPWLLHLLSRAQQFFGLVYYHTSHEVPVLQPAAAGAQLGRPLEALPAWLLPRVLATGVFAVAGEVNQVAVNEYRRDAGISHHVEDPTAFGANLATLSLLEPVQLTLTPADEPVTGRDGHDHGNWVKVLLEPRSLLVLQGESRYAYRHGIRRSRRVPLPEGGTRQRDQSYRRISLTFRELLETRRMLDIDGAASSSDETLEAAALLKPEPFRLQAV